MNEMISKALKHKLAVIGLIVFLSCSAFGLSVKANSSAEKISLKEYWFEIEATLALVVRQKSLADGFDGQVFEDKAQFWEGVSIIELLDGGEALIDTSFLVKLLRENPPDFAFLESHLEMLLEAEKSLPHGRHTAADVEVLLPILEKPEFQWQTREKSPFSQKVEQLLSEIRNFLARLLPENGITLNIDFSILYYILTAVLLVFLIRFFFTQAQGSLINEARLQSTEIGDEVISADTALKRAQEFSTKGDHRTAVRYLYLSALLYLEERKILRYDKTKTNREYLVSVEKFPNLSSPFNNIVEIFDQTWYGVREIDEDTFIAYEEDVAELRDRA